MRKIVISILFCICVMQTRAMQISFSAKEVKTSENLLSEMVRIDPEDEYFLYAGYSTAADEFDDQGFLDESRYLGHEQLYMKLSVTF